MRTPTKRVRGSITIEYQMTDVREARFLNLLDVLIGVVRTSEYPNEFLNPDKEDFIYLLPGEPKL